LGRWFWCKILAEAELLAEVAVIIPAYNQARYLGQAVESVLAQTFDDWEAVIVDDGSTDETPQVAQCYADRRIRYVRQQNRGLSAARNTGIRQSSAPWLSFLDSDDMFLPQKLSLLLAEAQRKPELGLIAGQAQPIDERNRRVGKLMDAPLPQQPEYLLLGNPLHVGSVLLRRDWQERAGFFDESLRSYEDWDMWLRLGRLGCPMGYVHQPVSLYRFHTAQMTRIGRQMTQATFAVLDKLYADPDLPPAWMALHDLAYSRAYLRAAAQAYFSPDLEEAKACLQQACQLDPTLLEEDAAALADVLRAWLDLPKTRRPLEHLERIYDNLPAELAALRRQKRQRLGQAAVEIAFQAYQLGDMELARYAMPRAFRWQPRYLLNRGCLAVFIRSLGKRH